MSSNTRKVTHRRAATKARSGRWRKNQVAIIGSTQPNLPLNVPNANELKQIEAKKKQA